MDQERPRILVATWSRKGRSSKVHGCVVSNDDANEEEYKSPAADCQSCHDTDRTYDIYHDSSCITCDSVHSDEDRKAQEPFIQVKNSELKALAKHLGRLKYFEVDLTSKEDVDSCFNYLVEEAILVKL